MPDSQKIEVSLTKNSNADSFRLSRLGHDNGEFSRLLEIEQSELVLLESPDYTVERVTLPRDRVAALKQKLGVNRSKQG